MSYHHDHRCINRRKPPFPDHPFGGDLPRLRGVDGKRLSGQNHPGTEKANSRRVRPKDKRGPNQNQPLVALPHTAEPPIHYPLGKIG